MYSITNRIDTSMAFAGLELDKVERGLIDPVTCEPLFTAVNFSSCKHIFNKSVVNDLYCRNPKPLCPTCRTPIKKLGGNECNDQIIRELACNVFEKRGFFPYNFLDQQQTLDLEQVEYKKLHAATREKNKIAYSPKNPWFGSLTRSVKSLFTSSPQPTKPSAKVLFGALELENEPFSSLSSDKQPSAPISSYDDSENDPFSLLRTEDQPSAPSESFRGVEPEDSYIDDLSAEKNNQNTSENTTTTNSIPTKKSRKSKSKVANPPQTPHFPVKDAVYRGNRLFGNSGLNKYLGVILDIYGFSESPFRKIVFIEEENLLKLTVNFAERDSFGYLRDAKKYLDFKGFEFDEEKLVLDDLSEIKRFYEMLKEDVKIHKNAQKDIEKLLKKYK